MLPSGNNHQTRSYSVSASVKRSASPRHPAERSVNHSVNLTTKQHVSNTRSMGHSSTKLEEVTVGSHGDTVKRSTTYTQTTSRSIAAQTTSSVSSTVPRLPKQETVNQPSRPFIDLTSNDGGTLPFTHQTGGRWQFELDLFVDPVAAFTDEQLTSLIDLLSTVYPFSCVTRIAVPLTTHAEIIAQCWNSTRRQLNGLSVLNILDAQAEIVNPLSFTPAQSLAFTSSATKRVVSRAKWQADRDKAQSGSQSPVPTSAASAIQSTSRTRTASVALGDHRSGSRLKADIGEDAEGGTRTTTEVIDEKSLKLTDEERLQIHEVSKSLRESRTSAAVRRSYSSQPGLSDEFVLPHSTVKTRPNASITPSIAPPQPTAPPHSQFIPINQLKFRINADYSKRVMKFSLFLTDLDAFVPSLTFIFGVARMGRCAIVSTHRLILNNAQESESFLAKECIHEIGHMFGLHHCVNPCVMAYSTSVNEALKKSNMLCHRCAVKVAAMQFGMMATC